MTTLSIYSMPNLNVISFLHSRASNIMSQISKARQYNQTVSELKKLSPRMLEDIGVSESNIYSVAYDYIYEEKTQ